MVTSQSFLLFDLRKSWTDTSSFVSQVFCPWFDGLHRATCLAAVLCVSEFVPRPFNAALRL